MMRRLAGLALLLASGCSAGLHSSAALSSGHASTVNVCVCLLVTRNPIICFSVLRTIPVESRGRGKTFAYFENQPTMLIRKGLTDAMFTE